MAYSSDDLVQYLFIQSTMIHDLRFDGKVSILRLLENQIEIWEILMWQFVDIITWWWCFSDKQNYI